MAFRKKCVSALGLVHMGFSFCCLLSGVKFYVIWEKLKMHFHQLCV